MQQLSVAVLIGFQSERIVPSINQHELQAKLESITQFLCQPQLDNVAALQNQNFLYIACKFC